MNLEEMEKVANFDHHKFVIKMLDPKDWACHYNEGSEVVNDFVLPHGPHMKEFSDTVYHAGTEVAYHQHNTGYETFEIAAGRMDCVVDGKRFIGEAGDIIHLPPYTAHGFIWLEEGTIWRELFHDIDMAGGIHEKNMVNNYYAYMKEDPEFMAMYRSGKSITRENPKHDELPLYDHKDVYQVRTPDFAWMTHEGEGYSIKLKIEKFETAGTKEIWYADLKKGLKVEYKYPHNCFELLYVKSGKLELTIDHAHGHPDAQTFIVEGSSIIHIPPYHTFTIRILEDTAIYNYGGEYDLKACLEDMQSKLRADAHAFDNEEDRLKFQRRYGVYATSVTYEKE